MAIETPTESRNTGGHLCVARSSQPVLLYFLHGRTWIHSWHMQLDSLRMMVALFAFVSLWKTNKTPLQPCSFATMLPAISAYLLLTEDPFAGCWKGGTARITGECPNPGSITLPSGSRRHFHPLLFIATSPQVKQRLRTMSRIRPTSKYMNYRERDST